MSLQMTCPYCKREFPYDNGDLDRKISLASQRIQEITLEIAKIKAMHPKLRRKREGRRSVLVLELNEAQKEITELKAVRKACDQQIKHYDFETFKRLVKERYGEEEYRKLYTHVEEELQAYRVSDLMKHEYTRSNAKADVISINKL